MFTLRSRDCGVTGGPEVGISFLGVSRSCVTALERCFERGSYGLDHEAGLGRHSVVHMKNCVDLVED